jgi:midasin
MDNMVDIEAIVRAHLQPPVLATAPLLLQFWSWYHATLTLPGKSPLTLRDVLAWCLFVCQAAPLLGPVPAYLHGAFLVVIDGQGLGGGVGPAAAKALRAACVAFLVQQAPAAVEVLQVAAGGSGATLPPAQLSSAKGEGEAQRWGMAQFLVATGDAVPGGADGYYIEAPTTARNCFRVLRAMQLRKPILLEGSPGVGKTSLIAAMAAMSGHVLVRINLSDQTDIMDLLGSDLPVAEGEPGMFCWSDGPLLSAVKAGHWVLLDELNLASQSVLEGLNAVLDHRRELFIPELGYVVRCPPTFRVFAAQNPIQEGGGRKGLPRSFLNRFTRVAVELFDQRDLLVVAEVLHSGIPLKILQPMVTFVERMHHLVNVERSFGQVGAPWEFNLRDLLRWCDLVESTDTGGVEVVSHFARMLFIERLRTPQDRAVARDEFVAVWGAGSPEAAAAAVAVRGASKVEVALSTGTLRVGKAILERGGPAAGAAALPVAKRAPAVTVGHVATAAIGLADAVSEPALEWVTAAAERGWMSLLMTPDPPRAVHALRALAALVSKPLLELSLTPTADTSDLLGGFEQFDAARVTTKAMWRAAAIAEAAVREGLAPRADRSGGAKSAAERVAAARTVTVTAASLRSAAAAAQPWSSATTVDAGVALRLALPQLLEGLGNAGAAVSAALSAALTAVEMAQGVLREAKGAALGGRFMWRDGALLAAIEQGHWVMLQHPNACSGSVLDRLNSLLESKGSLYVNECGSTAAGPRIVIPHKDFRIFLVADPSRGEVSRAMRNRGIEVFWGAPEATDTEASTLDSIQVRKHACVHSATLLSCLIALSSRLRTVFSSSQGPCRHKMILVERCVARAEPRARVQPTASYQNKHVGLNLISKGCPCGILSRSTADVASRCAPGQCLMAHISGVLWILLLVVSVASAMGQWHVQVAACGDHRASMMRQLH